MFTATVPTLRSLTAPALPAALLGLGIAAGALAPGAAAQSVDLLNDLSGPRGLTTRGEGGLQGPLIDGFVKPVPGDVGRSVVFLDANGDGIDDLLVGAPLMPTDPLDPMLVSPPPFPPPDEAGHAFLIFGSEDKGTPGSDAEIDLRLMGPGEGIDFIGPPGSRAGTAVAAVGDVNADGFQDFAIGTPLRSEAGRNLCGGAYLVLGGATIGNGSPQQFLEDIRNTSAGTFIRGPRSMAMVGSALGGGIDADDDGNSDIILGAPFDSSDGLLQNGSAWIVYGFNSIANVAQRDLVGALPAGKTEVRGDDNFQLLGWSVAGIGNFDPVLPGQAGAESFDGDDFAIGVPSASLNGKLLSGAAVILRGVDGALPDDLVRLSDFGDGEDDAGPIFTGGSQGDRAGSWVARAGEMIFPGGDGAPFDDLIVTAPLNGDLGRPERGATYLIPGAFDGTPPTGYDLSLAGTPARPNSLEILGQATGEGTLGVWAVPGGDWDGDGRRELIMGTPSSAFLDVNFVTHLQAGRVRVLDGDLLVGLLGTTLNLDFPPPGLFQLQFGGEASGFHAGVSVASGDHNGDGDPDLATGAPGAASRPSNEPFGSVAWRETGRAHAVYGPIFRLGNVAPQEVFFGGPDVEMEVFNLVEPFTVDLDGVVVEIVDAQTGGAGSITFAVPPPPGAPPFGPLTDLTLDTPLGSQTFTDFIQFVETEITEPPNPDRGLPGQTFEIRGIAFNDVEEFGVRDTEVFIEGFPMIVQSVVFDPPEEGGDGSPDVPTATITVELVEGPPLNTPLDVLVSNSNGSDMLEDAFTFKTIMVTGVDPATGPAESGVFDEDQTGPPPFMGEPAIEVEVTVDSSIIPPVDLVFEFGNDDDGFQVLPFTLDGDTFTFTLPSHLKGPVDVPMDIRVTDSTGTDTAEGIFTYDESDFERRDDFDESTSYGVAGFGAQPPRLRMAGELSPGCDVLVLVDRLAAQTSVAALFVSLGEFVPPIQLGGGAFGPDVSDVHFFFLFPDPAPQFSLPFRINPDPSGLMEGLPIYLQIYAEETDDVVIRIALSNLLIGYIDLSPEKCEPAPPPPGG